MTINQLHVNTGGLKFRYIKAAEHYEWTDGNRSPNQTRHPDTGQLLWKVTVTILSPDTSDAATGTVTVPATEKPEAAFDSEIDFEGLTVRFWSRNGQLGQSFIADAIKTTKPAGRKPTTAPTGAAS